MLAAYFTFRFTVDSEEECWWDTGQLCSHGVPQGYAGRAGPLLKPTSYVWNV